MQQLDLFPAYHTQTITHADCLDHMRTIDDNSIDCIVTDPPYGIAFMGKGWDKGIPSIEYWQEMLRILKPGGHLLAAGLPRMMHRLICIIEDAGFQIRDLLMHLFGSGFPKSHNHFGFPGYGTALKPAWEGWSLAMKSLDGTFAQNAEKWGVSGINIDGCRIGNDLIKTCSKEKGESFTHLGKGEGYNGCPQSVHIGRWPANLILDEFYEQILTLKDNISPDIISIIQEYYCDYQLPNLPKRNKDISFQDQDQQGTVLQQDLLLQGIEQPHEGRETFHVREDSYEGIYRKNKEEKDKERQGKPQIQGFFHESRIPSCESGLTSSGSINLCSENDFTKSNCRTSPNDGNKNESPIATLGSGASCQWSKRRQQNGESGSIGQFNTQKGTQGYIEGITCLEKRKRRIEIIASDISEKWLKYFEESGDEIRSPYCAAEMLDQQSGISKSISGGMSYNKNSFHLNGKAPKERTGHDDFGGASRFFYCPKASSAERNAGLDKSCAHPTVKPLALMRYLLKLVMPPNSNAIVLDPFAGSGSTLVAAKQLGFNAIGIEKEAEYCEIARKRIEHA